VAIYRLLQNSAFEPEDIEELTAAYEKSLVLLKLNSRTDPLTEIIAQKIIEVAQTGRKGADLICTTALTSLGLSPALEENDSASLEWDYRLALETVLEHMSCGVGLMDRHGKWLMVNATMRKYVPERIPSHDPQRTKRWRAFDGELEPYYWPGARALRGETVRPGIRFIFTTDEGQEILTEVAAAPFRNGKGDLVGAIAVVNEITESVGNEDPSLRIA
jgi:PAS domain-containing protein